MAWKNVLFLKQIVLLATVFLFVVPRCWPVTVITPRNSRPLEHSLHPLHSLVR